MRMIRWTAFALMPLLAKDNEPVNRLDEPVAGVGGDHDHTRSRNSARPAGERPLRRRQAWKRIRILSQAVRYR